MGSALMGIGVTGGPGSIHAVLDDLAVVARDLDRTATEALDAAAATGHAAHALGADDAAATIQSTVARTTRAADSLGALARTLRFARLIYQHHEDSLADSVLHAAAELPGSILRAGVAYSASHSLSVSFQQFITGDPALVEAFSALDRSGMLTDAISALCDDGHARVTPIADDAFGTRTPPRSIEDLISGLALRDEGSAGQISVSFLIGADGRRRAVVDIPGTKSWAMGHTADVTSLATNVRAIDGHTTSYEQGVLEAMRQAGVSPQDEVMMVGHSEGGMVAITAARDAVATGRYQVTHVITAGSPIARTVHGLPPSVQVLALEDRHDIVPQLDGTSNPDSISITTVTGGPDHGDVVANHDLTDSYESLARQVDTSDKASIRAFLASASGFLQAEDIDTLGYLITRGY